MRIAAAATVAMLFAGSQACFLTAHSSTVGDFPVQHSEPKDHGGATQYVNWAYKSCTIKGTLQDGCGVEITSDTGCGTVTFTIRKSG